MRQPASSDPIRLDPEQIRELERTLLETPVCEWVDPLGHCRVSRSNYLTVSHYPPNITVDVTVNGAVINVPITMNWSGLPRRDAICLHLGAVVVVVGTPSDDPRLPPLLAGSDLLAAVDVGSGATCIVNRDIADLRRVS